MKCIVPRSLQSITDLGSWTTESIDIDNRPEEEFRQGFYWDSCCSTGEQEQVTGALARSLRQRRAGYGVRVGAGWWVWSEGWLRWSAPLLGGAVCREHARYPASVPGTSEVAGGFWPFCILLFIICPNCS